MSQHDNPSTTPPQGAFHERSDAWLACVLGPDLQSATLRGGVLVLIAGVVLATIAALVG